MPWSVPCSASGQFVLACANTSPVTMKAPAPGSGVRSRYVIIEGPVGERGRLV